mmetsp:Transcript_42183/g.51373  ORF Transcript_42183/g.51373 Transcript_42183/m.51373 type:complete len:315 (-) Transcript_42183:147-1091(-)|eukprot:CAMPEP_0172484408 /NCGR_PEP_ID=MMETSP1066-20121228/11877_1 /TAXON_ID=671091 /ORGANISM="Coscinodiscus wailesii, Strain CCMP2513" /LENGTH=314 /DNA_ID=CAMNT_0013248919 /DNA_START=67 /DNA_END=1011 /DNA_ORIENTATION=+
MRFLLPFLLASVSAGDTTVAVIEIGKSGVVRRTTSSSAQTSASAVSSFWNKLHDVGNGQRRMKATQHPGMSVVPDLFRKPSGGLIIGLKGNGVDLASMPTVSRQLQSSAGHFEVSGSLEELLNKAPNGAEALEDNFSPSLQNKVRELKAGENTLESISFNVNNDKDASNVDAAVGAALESVRKLAEQQEGTIVVHLVIEEEDGAMRRRLMTRDLAGDDDEDKDEDKDEAEDEDAEQGAQYQQKSNFYGYGYYNDYGEWISNYKTIFQIQYFQIVLWSSIGLCLILSMSLYYMMNMPMMSDTLLFGESAKMMGGT